LNIFPPDYLLAVVHFEFLRGKTSCSQGRQGNGSGWKRKKEKGKTLKGKRRPDTNNGPIMPLHLTYVGFPAQR
jgi:hypothetical protein